MFKTTNQTTARKMRRFQRPQTLWPIGLHRRIAAAATVGAVCAFSLQMRNQGIWSDSDAAGDAGSTNPSLGEVGRASLREESP
jgi:hypothetical protein